MGDRQMLHAIDREFCEAQRKNIYDKRGAETVKNDRWKKDHVRLRVYACPDCGGWHVTKVKV